LFNLLVVDDDIAADIIKYVRQYQPGSIVCTPLNQIRPRPREYPKIKGCTPLVDLITCADAVRPAVLQVFGRTMVCNNIELCDVVSHKHGLDAVTMEGDRVSSQGTMTGGYQDPNRYVRLKLCAERRNMEVQLENITMKLPEVDALVTESSKHLDQLHHNKRNAYALRQNKRTELSQGTEALHEGEREHRRLAEAVGRQKEREHEVNTCLAEYDAGIDALIRERQSTSLGQLSAEEHGRVEALTNELRDLGTNVDASEEQCHKAQRELRAQEQHLNGYLRRRHHEIEAELLRTSQQDHHEHAKERERAVPRLSAQVAEIETEMDRLSETMREDDEAMGEKKQRLDEMKRQATSFQAIVNAQFSSLDDIAMKIQNLTKKRGEYDEKLRKLTIVAADMEFFKQMTTDDIIEELRNVNKELHKFEHVNKKAIDQFATFQDQLKDLDDEGVEMTRSKEAIERFILEVDTQKEHLLADVLHKVDEHFQDIFKELVKDGSARLTMINTVDEDIETSQRPAKKRAFTAPDLASGVKGVKIEVSFTGQTTSFLTMSQLSGGQKTVVALSLIFAMQRLEPAPFYLFDEVDAALDTQYRVRVAKLIQKDAQNGVQMILTTFRPEIIEIADHCYRVAMRNRVSVIDCVEKAAAKEVVDQQAVQEGLGE